MRTNVTRILRTIATVSVAVLASSPLMANDLDNAPSSFDYLDGKAVPVDFHSVNLELRFDVATSKTFGTATVNFSVEEDGYPFFDLVPEVLSAELDTVTLAPSDIPTINDPDVSTKLRVVTRKISGGSTHQLVLTYALREGVTYSDGVAKAGFFMTDLKVGGRGFWEQYGPANYEYDQFQQTIVVRVNNASKSHKIYTNAEMKEVDANAWELTFPDYFTTSSFYLHMAEAGRFVEKTAVYRGIEANIPVLVYAEASSDATQGLQRALGVLAENEGTFGAFAHAKAIAYITPGGGGMEYGGATMTSIWALEHEFTHFWFARSVMPANGNAGWIDEAVASWRDNGYPRASSGPTGAARSLGGFSPYRRHTTTDAYTKGAALMSEFDKQFASFTFEEKTGMRGILRSLFNERKNTTITVEFFKTFMEAATGADLTAVFNKYVYGRGAVAGEADFSKRNSNHHPRPYTQDELLIYR